MIDGLNIEDIASAIAEQHKNKTKEQPMVEVEKVLNVLANVINDNINSKLTIALGNGIVGQVRMACDQIAEPKKTEKKQTKKAKK